MDPRPLLAAGLDAAVLLPAQEAGAKSRLRAFASCDQLVSYARARAATAPDLISAGRPVTDRPESGAQTTGALTAASAPATTQAAPEPDFSTTNVQEQGIDEPDVVKTDGKVIYALSYGGVEAVDARAQEPKLLGTLGLSGASDAQLLLHGDRLFVIDTSYGNPVGTALRSVAVPGSVIAYQPVTAITEVDVHDPAAMRVVRTTSVDGTFVDARQTGATARLVVSTPPRPVPLPADSDEPFDVQKATAIGRTGTRTWVPRRRTVAGNGVVGKLRKLVGCRSVRRPALFSGLGTLTVLTVDMDKGLPAVDADGVMTSADTVYGSADSLYVATERYYDPSTPFSALAAYRATAIHRFDASTPNETTYRATGEPAGFPLKQFSMSEGKGVVRVATSGTPARGPG